MIIFWFNPWRYNGSNQFSNAFFQDLSTLIKPYHKNLSADIRKYATVLSSAHPAITVFTKLSETIYPEQLSKRFEEINQNIKKIDKRIVVFIDDLDRLDDKEICEIFKLIRNNANFANMVFIAAYDRMYVTNAIKRMNEYRSSFFIEKIFQTEFTLPIFDQKHLYNRIVYLATCFIQGSDFEAFKSDLLDENIKNNFLKDEIKTMRDSIRFVNYFASLYEQLKDNIIMVDLMNIALLIMKYPAVYHLLASRWSEFLIINYPTSPNFVLYNSSNDNNLFSSGEPKLDLIEHLTNNKTELGIEGRIENVTQIITQLFPANAISKGLNSINTRSIKRYFYYSLLHDDISKKELNELWSSSFEKQRNLLDKWSETKSISLIEAFISKKLQTWEEYCMFVRITIYFVSISDWWKIKYNQVKHIINEGKKFKNKKFKEILLDAINENRPNLYLAMFLGDIYKDGYPSFVLSLKEILDILIGYWKEYTNLPDASFDVIYEYFLLSKFVNDRMMQDDDNEIKINREKEIFEFLKISAEKYIDVFLPYSISHLSKSKYEINDLTTKLWDSKECFIDWIKGLPSNSKKIEEYKKFIELYEKNGLNPIEFEF